MAPYFRERFGNSASGLHQFGWEAEKAVAEARKKVAAALGVAPFEIYFTSGATESNNWALRGVIEQFLLDDPKQAVHVLTSATEHHSVLTCLEHLKKLMGAKLELEVVPVNSKGVIELAELQKRLRPNTRLVSVMWVNNEIGSLQPVEQIGQWAAEHKIYFHTDATQAMGKIPVDLRKVHCDLLSLSAHKVYGPKGSGLLYIRGKDPKVRLQPLLLGGGHERGLRSGTLNVPAIVGMGRALELMTERLESDQRHLLARRQDFFKGLESAGISYQLNGGSEGVASIANLTFPNAKLGLAFPGVAYSKGSACHSDQIESSHVLRAIGLTDALAERSFRFSWGRETTSQDITNLITVLKAQLS